MSVAKESEFLPAPPESVHTEDRRRLLAWKTFDKLASILILVLILVLMEVLYSGFVSTNNLLTIGVQAATRAILAMGVMLVIISGGIDISVGTVMSFSMVVMGVFILNFGVPWLIGLVISVLAGGFAGVINGVLIAYGGLPPFIATLGMLGIAQGAALTLSNGRSMYGFPPIFEQIGGNVAGVPVPILIVVAAAALMSFVFYQTRIGRYAFAIGGNEEAVRRAGIDVRRYKLGIYALCGATAGLSGIVLTSRINSAHPGVGFGYELDAIAAAVIGGASLMGGRGTVSGAIIGALIMSTIRFGLNVLGMSPFLQQIVVGVILIAAVYFDQVRLRQESRLDRLRAARA